MSDLIDAKEAATLLNVSRPTVLRLAASGAIASIELSRGGKRGRRLFSRAALLAFIARGLSGGGGRGSKATRLPDAKSAALAREVNELEASCERLHKELLAAVHAGRLLSKNLTKKAQAEPAILEAITTLENLALAYLCE